MKFQQLKDDFLMLNKNNTNLTLFRLGLIILLFSSTFFYCHYINSIKVYDDFTVSVFDNNGENISDYFGLFGVSNFGDTIDFVCTEGKFFNNKDGFYKELDLIYNYHNIDSVTVVFSNNNNTETHSYTAYYQSNYIIKNLFGNNSFFNKIRIINFLKIISIIFIVFLITGLIIFTKLNVIILALKRIQTWQKSKLILLTSIIVFLFLAYIACVLLKQYRETDTYPDFRNVMIKKIPLARYSDSYIITIEDTAKTGLEFVFTLNDNFWFHQDSLLKHIHNLQVEDSFHTRKEIVQAWKFVCKNSYHSCTMSEIELEKTVQFPSLMLNSVGYGQCSDRAQLLRSLWIMMGYKVRIANIKSYHTFPEVFDGEKWMMLDPDFGLLLLNEAGRISSLTEIINDAALFPIKFTENNFICNYTDMICQYPTWLEKIYKMDSLLSYSKSLNYKFENTYFELPVGSKVVFPIYSDNINGCLLKIIIPDFYSGNVRIPLLIKSLINNENSKTDSLIKSGHLFGKFEIRGRNIEIQAYINPLLFMFKDQDTVAFNYYTNSTVFPKITILKYTDTSNYIYSITKLLPLIAENKDKYLEISDSYLKKFKLKITDWAEFQNIIAMHYVNGIYPEQKILLLKNIMFSDKKIQNAFYDWINYPENLALILILLDRCENNNDYIDFWESFILII